jgi:hypothetical protein
VFGTVETVPLQYLETGYATASKNEVDFLLPEWENRALKMQSAGLNQQLP